MRSFPGIELLVGVRLWEPSGIIPGSALGAAVIINEPDPKHRNHPADEHGEFCESAPSERFCWERAEQLSGLCSPSAAVDHLQKESSHASSTRSTQWPDVLVNGGRILPSLLVSCILSIPGRAAATRRNSWARQTGQTKTRHSWRPRVPTQRPLTGGHHFDSLTVTDDAIRAGHVASSLCFPESSSRWRCS